MRLAWRQEAIFMRGRSDREAGVERSGGGSEAIRRDGEVIPGWRRSDPEVEAKRFIITSA